MSGNTNETGDAGESPGKSSLFFLTTGKAAFFVLSGALSTAFENPVA